MKKVLFAALLLVGTSTAFSQVNQGQWLVGGNAGFRSSKQGEGKMTSFNFSPDAGYFFINNFAGGLRINLESSKVKGADESESQFTVAPFLRYYFLPAAKKVNVFADAEYGFGSAKDGESASINEYKIQAGPAVFLSQSAALEFTLYYASFGGKAYGDDRMSHIGLNVGFQIHLGGGKTK
jgi:Outer membrane protein beta-barrel domain